MRDNKPKNRFLLSIIAIACLLILIATSQIYCSNMPDPSEEVTTNPSVGATESTEPNSDKPTTTIPETTDAPVSDPTEAAETTPIELLTEPTESETQPSKPEETEPEETVPEETEPIENTPPATEPPATEPPATEPTESPHTHSYSETIIKPTCDEGGYTIHTCSCGKSYTDSDTSALGHNYSESIVEPTVDNEGYTEHTCTRCGDSYRDNYTEKLLEDTQPSSSNYYVPDRTCNSCYAWISGNVIDQHGELVMRYECPHCGHVNVFPYTQGHACSFSVTVVQPDCITAGYTWNECSCGNYYISEHTDKLGHDFSFGNTCSRCGFTEESLITLDYEDAMAYGNQYAVDTYGWYIDLDLNFENAGYNFPGSGSKAGIIERGGQQDLYRLVRKEIDYLYDSLIDRGTSGKAYFNCYVCEEDGIVLVYAFYG